MSSEWHKVNHLGINVSRKERLRGLEVEVKLSPYDIPDAYRTYFDPIRNKCVIDFKYLDFDEPAILIRSDDGDVAIKVGAESKRVVSIEFSSSQDPNLQFHLDMSELEKAFRQLSNQPRTRRELGNYDVAKKIIQNEDYLCAP